MQPRLAITALCTCPLLMWWTIYSQRAGKGLHLEREVLDKKLSTIKVEAITNIRAVHSFLFLLTEL